MPRKSAMYLQRELDFYQLPSLDELNQSFDSRDIPFSTKAASKKLMQEIVDEIKKGGLEDMFPWCVYIYSQVPSESGKPQRRILVLPDAVRADHLDTKLRFTKDRNHDEFVEMMKDPKLYLDEKEFNPSQSTSDNLYALQSPTDELVEMIREEARSLGLSIEARNMESVKDNATGKNIDFEDLPFLRCHLSRS